MTLRKTARTMVFYGYAFFQGFCLILIPAASFILKQEPFGSLSEHQYGGSFLPMNLSAVLVTVFFRAFLRRFGRQTLLAAGLAAHGVYAGALGAAALAGPSNAAVFFWLLLANLSLGIGFGLLISTANLAMVELHSEERDIYLMGLHGLLGVGAALAPAAVEFFFSRGLWRYSHAAYLIFWAALMASALILRPADYRLTGPGEAPEARGGGIFSLPPGAWFFLAAIFVYGIAESIAGNWASLFLTIDKQFTFRTAARSLSAFWISLTLGRILAALAATRVDARLLYRLSPVVMTAALIFLLRLRQEFLAVPVYALLGLGCSYFFPLSVGLSTQYHNRWRDELSSLGIGAIMAGVSFGTTLMGLLQGQKIIRIGQTFGLACACSALLTLISFALTRKKPPV